MVPIISYAEIDWNTVNLARAFGKDIFELNGVPYLQPMVESINATSNSRFFNQAYVPSEVDKPYFKISVNTMLGFVRDNQKTYSPQLPTAYFDISNPQTWGELQKYADIDLMHQKIIIKDTAGLMYYALKTVLYDGIYGAHKGLIKVPQNSATILGKQDTLFYLPHNALDSLVRSNPVYQFLPKSFQDTLIATIAKFPESFALPPGANINTMFAIVPQFEIGSLFGTEMLIRFIPPVYMGSNIGHFAFWGIGLKHSISQYFPGMPFDMAVQAVYQGTSLKNDIGVTSSKLNTMATFWDFNLQIGKSYLDDKLNFYSGFSFESININSDFTFTLPIALQWQLGLIEGKYVPVPNSKDSVFVLMPPDPARGFPGDSVKQTSNIRINDFNFKWVIGASYQIGPIAVFLDYNVSKFNIFTGGIEVSF